MTYRDMADFLSLLVERIKNRDAEDGFGGNKVNPKSPHAMLLRFMLEEIDEKEADDGEQ